MQLFKRCSKTDDTGTDLLLFQLTSFLVRISFKDKLCANIIKQDEGLLDECIEQYRQNHGNYYQVSGPNINNQTQSNNYRNNSNHNQSDNHQKKKSAIKGFNMRRAINNQ